jgi:hypothetical protein
LKKSNPKSTTSHGNCDKVCPTDSDFFLDYLVPLHVDVTRNITAKICEVWNEFKKKKNTKMIIAGYSINRNL